jgi:transcriptional regulator with XRE-family HTH domain
MTGNILKEKLQMIDIQLVELASIIGISPQSLNSRLKTKDVTISFLIEICVAIKKSPYYFFKGTEYEKYFKETEYEDFEKQLGLNEPDIHYKTNNPIVETQAKTINILEREVDDLRDDKRFLKEVIENRMGNAKAG